MARKAMYIPKSKYPCKPGLFYFAKEFERGKVLIVTGKLRWQIENEGHSPFRTYEQAEKDAFQMLENKMNAIKSNIEDLKKLRKIYNER